MYLINVFHPLIEKRRIIVTKFLSFLLFTIWINMQDDKKFRTPFSRQYELFSGKINIFSNKINCCSGFLAVWLFDKSSKFNQPSANKLNV